MGKMPPARVIVVDDEPSICSLVRDILEHADYVVATSTVPQQALDLVKQSDRFDLAIIDVVMPAMPGDELATAMRAVEPDLKVLFLTGYPGALFQARPPLWAGEAFLEKPCRTRRCVATAHPPHSPPGRVVGRERHVSRHAGSAVLRRRVAPKVTRVWFRRRRSCAKIS